MQEKTKQNIMHMLVYLITAYYTLIVLVIGWSEIFSPDGEEQISTIGSISAVIVCIAFPIISKMIGSNLTKRFNM